MKLHSSEKKVYMKYDLSLQISRRQLRHPWIKGDAKTIFMKEIERGLKE